MEITGILEKNIVFHTCCLLVFAFSELLFTIKYNYDSQFKSESISRFDKIEDNYGLCLDIISRTADL